ncbi:MAG: hypothetical protein IKQ30_15300 [Bacteroidales bacterium]|nr:hypothetical protein [Bacteroidales bacterium]MBR4274188.1 hypothetical protein [Bacteroidales bacterium]
MKRNILTPTVAIALAATALLSSCKKEEYDLDNISDNILFNTSLGAPLIAQRDISLIDFFDMEMKGKFSVTEDEARKIRMLLSPDGKTETYLPDCLDPVNLTIDLSKMNGLDMEKLQDLDIAFNETLPSSEDFIEIDDLDKTFGEGNAINEIDEFELKMEIDNKTDFQIALSIEFAKTVRILTANGIEEVNVPIDDTKASSGESHQIIVPARKKGEAATGLKTYTLTFSNIAQKIKDNHATGLLISYELSQGEMDQFTIKATDGLSMSLKAYVSATIDLSNI